MEMLSNTRSVVRITEGREMAFDIIWCVDVIYRECGGSRGQSTNDKREHCDGKESVVHVFGNCEKVQEVI